MPVANLVVTGVASGIGRAVAQQALREGAQVYGLDLQPSGIEHERFCGFECDVTALDSVREALRRVFARNIGVPTRLIHCAGIYLKSPSADADLPLWIRGQEVNTTGTFLVATLFARQLLDRSLSGSIVLLSSTAAFLGDAFEPSASYSASKGAVISLGRQFAVEWGPHGIRTNVVVPGVIDTPMTTVVNDPEAYASVLADIPMGRLGRAGEVAAVCLFLTSLEAGFVNGAIVPVDGGQLNV